MRQLNAVFDLPPTPMHQTSRISFSRGDPMRECEKQKEKLDLIQLECVISWVEKMLLAKGAKASRLNDEISNLQHYRQALNDEKDIILEALSPPSALCRPENFKKTLKLLEINSKINDAQAAVELICDELLTQSAEINELEIYEADLKTDFEEETRKWHSRWPEENECCMIMRFELGRVQAELNATYQQIYDNFGAEESSKLACSPTEANSCATSQTHTETPKRNRGKPEVTKHTSRDLIAFDDFLKENGAKRDIPDEIHATDPVDLTTHFPEQDWRRSSTATDTNPSHDLVDLITGLSTEDQGNSEFSKVACPSDDLAVLIAEFPLLETNAVRSECPKEVHAIDGIVQFLGGGREYLQQTRTIDDIVQLTSKLLSKRFIQQIEQRFRSSNKDLKDLREEVHLMKPLYDIGLAIRKRKVEHDPEKRREEKDQNIIIKGNQAAHYGQVLADATWFMNSPDDKAFRDMYNGVPAKIVWEHRNFSKFQDILNWHSNMRQFNEFRPINQATFNNHFGIVFRRIYPHFKISDSDFDEKGGLRTSYACMRSEHSNASERDCQLRARNWSLLKDCRSQ